MNALILVDIQHDFLPGGALAVKGGDEIIPLLNKLTQLPFDLIIASKDWHPIDHGSFAITHGKLPGEHCLLEGLDQILWPVHCVQGTFGSEFSQELKKDKIDQVFYKGTDRKIDSYSTFFDNGHRKSTGLGEFLKEKKIKNLYIAGLTTDYCVKYSVLDALKLGFSITVIVDACRGVNLTEGDEKKALDEMRRAGAKICTSQEVARVLSRLVKGSKHTSAKDSGD